MSNMYHRILLLKTKSNRSFIGHTRFGGRSIIYKAMQCRATQLAGGRSIIEKAENLRISLCVDYIQ